MLFFLDECNPPPPHPRRLLYAIFTHYKCTKLKMIFSFLAFNVYIYFLYSCFFLTNSPPPPPPPLCRLLYAIFTNYKCTKMGCVEGRRWQEFRLNMMQLDQPDESVSKWVSFQTNDDRQKMAELNQGGIVQFRGQHWARHCSVIASIDPSSK